MTAPDDDVRSIELEDGAHLTGGMRVWYPVPPGHVVVEADRPAEFWVLEFIGAFSAVQDEVDFAVFSRIRSQSLRLAETMKEKYLTRINDQDRWEYVKALAVDVGYEGDMNMASDRFSACRRLRNAVAHTNQLLLLREGGTAEYAYQLAAGSSSVGVPTPLTPGVFRQFAADCRWLKALLVHLEWLGGMEFRLPVGVTRPDGSVDLPRIKMLPPPPLPVPPDWEFSTGGYRRLPDGEESDA